MAPTNIPYAQPGVASFELTDDFLNEHLLNGSDPKQEPATSGLCGADVRRFEVIGFDGDGEIVPATWNVDPELAIAPIGIATAAATAGQRVLFWISGNYNSDLILFHTSFDTEAKRLKAFFGAPSPTRIVLGPRFG